MQEGESSKSNKTNIDERRKKEGEKVP